MAFRPNAPYKHDGQILHPKLSYALPAAMEKSLVAWGLGASEKGEADIDLSALEWDINTTLHQASPVIPAAMQSTQS